MMIPDEFEHDFAEWLVNANASSDTSVGRSIESVLSLWYDDVLPSPDRPETIRVFAHDFQLVTCDFDPLIPDGDLVGRLCLHRMRTGKSKQFWTDILNALNDHGWHARQWVPATLLPSSLKHSRRESGSRALSVPDTQPQHASAVSGLLTLPGEIRNLIWRLAVLQDVPTVMNETGLLPVLVVNGYVNPSYGSGCRPRNPTPALASTCRQIRQETLSIYYAENNLSLALDTKEAFRASQRWLNVLSDEILALISGIVLQGLVMQDRSPVDSLGSKEAHCMRVHIDFDTLSARHEQFDGVDQTKELLVIEKTLTQILEERGEQTRLSREQLSLLVGNFARCCATVSEGTTVPLLAEGSRHDKLEARVEQAYFIDSFGRGEEDSAGAERLDPWITRFSIW